MDKPEVQNDTSAVPDVDVTTDFIGVDWGSEKLVRAQTAVRDNRWDLEAWGILIREAQTRYANEVRPFFEELVANFPTCGRYWKIYIEQEMRSRNFEKVEKA